MPEQYLLILTTMPDKTSAEQLAHDLVEKKLAACVNILDEMTAVYRWDDAIHTGTEYSLLIKTVQARYDAVQTFIHKQHPYELPEIIAVPVEQGLPAYLNWIKTCTENL